MASIGTIGKLTLNHVQRRTFEVSRKLEVLCNNLFTYTISHRAAHREFDVSSDVEEPAQTVSLLPSSKQVEFVPSKSKSHSRSNLYRSRSRSQTPTMHRSIRSSSKIMLDDDDDDENSEEEYKDSTPRTSSGSNAVAFTFGIDLRASEDDDIEQDGNAHTADWTAFTIYTLCGNGDVYALCPFMPKNA
jgi:nucleoporin NUP82